MVRVPTLVALWVGVLGQFAPPVYGSPCIPNAAPVADAGDNYVAQIGTPLTLDGSLSYDPDGHAISDYWFHFGDSHYTGWQPDALVQHTYTQLGTYDVTLWVRDECGAVSPAAYATVVVQEDDPGGGGQMVDSRGPAGAVFGGDMKKSVGGVGILPQGDPCDGNLPPSGVSAGGDRQVDVDEPINFAGSAQDDGAIVAWDWDFGNGDSATGQNVSYAYPAAGTFYVTLTVEDDCGAIVTSPAAVVTVSEPDPGVLSADFQVEMLTAYDPDTQVETWEVVDLANEEIELGLRIRFNGSLCTGNIGCYSWQFMDSTFGSNEIEIHAYQQPGSYDVALTVYDVTWQNWDTVVKTVHVGDGMEWIGSTTAAEDFFPVDAVVVGNELWAISAENKLGVADVSDPENPGPVQVMSVGPFSDLQTLTHRAGYLYLADMAGGVAIVRADQSACEIVGAIDASQLGGYEAWRVAAAGDLLFVGLLQPPTVYVFSLASPAQPVLEQTIEIPCTAIRTIRTPGDNYVAVRGMYSQMFWLIDARYSNPDDPNFASVLEFPMSAGGGEGLNALSGRSTATHSSGEEVFEVRTDAGPLQASSLGVVPQNGSSSTASLSRLFILRRNLFELMKYDISRVDQSYHIQTIPLPPGLGDAFFVDPDGHDGSIRGVLYFARWNGFELCRQ